MAGQAPPLPDSALALALAVVASSSTPMLLLTDDLAVVAASVSFCRAFGIDPVAVRGRPLFDLGAGEWNVPQLRSLLAATAAGSAAIEAYEMDLERDGREAKRLIINAQKLDYGEFEHVRLLLAVSDVTEARRADRLNGDLLREKTILLQEVQHRVANSLQIIASVLLQNARKVQSEETRLHLHDAHQRVMSVAALQQHLATSRLGEVELRTYFTQLCQSISASMIRDPDLLSIAVAVDDSTIKADISVCLGLIVTELAINAIKHAFPSNRPGKVTIGYRARGADWTLSVMDDGVGLPKGGASPKAGLGTSLVEALARQLNARIEVSGAGPGTKVSIIHEQVAGAPGERARPAA